MHSKLIVGISIGILAGLLVVVIGSLLFLRNLQRKTSHKKSEVQGLYIYTHTPQLSSCCIANFCAFLMYS
jgi:hypothetical protein